MEAGGLAPAPVSSQASNSLQGHKSQKDIISHEGKQLHGRLLENAHRGSHKRGAKLRPAEIEPCCYTSILHTTSCSWEGEGSQQKCCPSLLGTGTLLRQCLPLLAQTPGQAHEGWAKITDLISRELLVTLDTSHCKRLKYELFLTREKSGFDNAQQRTTKQAKS